MNMHETEKRMETGGRTPEHRRGRAGRIVLAFAAVLFCAAVLWQTAYWSRRIALDQIGERSRYTLGLIVEALRGDLAKYSYLPQLLARNEDFIAVLEKSGDGGVLRAVNTELERIRRISGASDIYLMNAAGLTVAASNWRSEKTFIGRNFSYRPYFQAAMAGRPGRYFALGTTSGTRGYYFSYPLRQDGGIVGVIVVKIQVDHHENAWRARDQEVIVADRYGVIFLSSEAGWRFRTLAPLPDAARARLRATRRYGDEPLAPLGFRGNGLLHAQGQTVIIAPPYARTRKTEFLVQKTDMPNAGWQVILLTNTAPAATLARVSLGAVTVVLLSIVLAAMLLLQRRRRLAERIAMQEKAKTLLEQRVRERTNELTETNRELIREVRERRRAEKELRHTQATLVQAAKLAALGQMSAGLSHELNQPLAAIRSYADNARAFLARGRADTAKANLNGIAELTERMARIIRNLRTYAREETVELRPVDLRVALGKSLALLEQRIRNEGVDILQDLPGGSLMVIAGDVRLQQVFVNLIANALDALKDSPRKEIHITAEERGAEIVIAIRDTGCGMAEEQIGNVFDPFYSTKAVGQGMGLGLSITFGLVNQFGGQIAAANAPGGGAVFTLSLKRAGSAEERST